MAAPLPPLPRVNPLSARSSRGSTDGLSAGKRAFERKVKKHSALAGDIRKERDERLSRHLVKDKGNNRVATREEQETLSVMLNKRMIEIFQDPAARSWYKLFNWMDDDCSGKINYHELEDMIRNELKVKQRDMSEDNLRALWRGLDEDESGLITQGEFGHFMMLGAYIHEVPREQRWLCRRQRAKEQRAGQVRTELQGLLSDTRAEWSRDLELRQRRAATSYDSLWGLSVAGSETPWRSPRALVF